MICLNSCVLGPSKGFKKALGHFLNQYFPLKEADLIQTLCNFRYLSIEVQEYQLHVFQIALFMA